MEGNVHRRRSTRNNIGIVVTTPEFNKEHGSVTFEWVYVDGKNAHRVTICTAADNPFMEVGTYEKEYQA